MNPGRIGGWAGSKSAEEGTAGPPQSGDTRVSEFLHTQIHSHSYEPTSARLLRLESTARGGSAATVQCNRGKVLQPVEILCNPEGKGFTQGIAFLKIPR